MADKLLDGARQVAKRLREAGHEAYFAGGCVRDKLLGRPCKDYDIVTDARPKRVAKIFKRTVMVGASFGVVRVQLGKDLDYEVATYREDGTYSDGRHPDEVIYSNDKETDVRRRDFTINALLMDPETDEILDFVGGQKDLDAGVIRAVGEPARRFSEDRLRIMRAARFAARFGFEIEAETLSAIEANATHITDVSVERIVGELHGLWGTTRPGHGMQILVSTQIAKAIFPELEPDDGPEELVRRCARFVDLDVSPLHREVIAWAAVADLMVDVDSEALLRRLKLSRPHIRGVGRILRQKGLLTDPGAFPLAERVRETLDDDFAASKGFLEVTDASQVARQAFADIEADLAAHPLPKLPLVTGGDLKTLGMRAGPHFKTLLRGVEDEVFERRITTKDAAIEWVKAQST